MLTSEEIEEDRAERLAEYNNTWRDRRYRPLFDCPVCHEGCFVHPLFPDGKPDYNRVIACRYKGCYQDSFDAYLRGETLQTSGITQTKQTFATFNASITGVQKAYNAAKKIAEGDCDFIWLIIYGGVGNGKCLAKGTKVIMASGEPRNVEDINEGDALMGPKGDIKIARGIMCGYGSLYRIRQSHGQEYIVNENHILHLVKSVACAKDKGERCRSGNYRHANGRYPDYGNEVDISVKDYMSKSDRWRHNFYGYRVAAEFPHRAVNIDPYFLGIWLGDGDSNRPVITTADTEIRDYIYDYAKYLGGNMSEYIGRTPRYRVNKTEVLAWLMQYGLLNNKHIPADYLYNSTTVRRFVLAGLIDTDGSLNTGCYDLIQKSEQLAKDITYLCHSLGLRCTLSKVQKGIKDRNFTGNYYRLNISGDIKQIPVRIARKVPVNIRKNKNPSLSSIAVEYVGEGDFYGFDLGGDGLFLLEDFTVTHNTHLLNAIANRVLERGYRVKLIMMAELLSELRMSIESNQVDFKMKELKEVPYLVIDELGLEYGTDWEKEKVEELLASRWSNGRFTVVATNRDIEELPPRIRDRFKDRHLSRWVKNEALSYRESKGSLSNRWTK